MWVLIKAGRTAHCICEYLEAESLGRPGLQDLPMVLHWMIMEDSLSSSQECSSMKSCWVNLPPWELLLNLASLEHIFGLFSLGSDYSSWVLYYRSWKIRVDHVGLEMKTTLNEGWLPKKLRLKPEECVQWKLDSSVEVGCLDKQHLVRLSGSHCSSATVSSNVACFHLSPLLRCHKVSLQGEEMRKQQGENEVCFLQYTGSVHSLPCAELCNLINWHVVHYRKSKERQS